MWHTLNTKREIHVLCAENNGKTLHCIKDATMAEGKDDMHVQYKNTDEWQLARIVFCWAMMVQERPLLPNNTCTWLCCHKGILGKGNIESVGSQSGFFSIFAVA